MTIIKDGRLSPAYGLALVLAIIVITALAVLLDIPVLRPILGILGYGLLPGVIILMAIKANRLGPAEKLVLAAGLSVIFLMLAGLIINLLYPALGNQTPLSTPTLVYSLSTIIITLSLIAYFTNRDAFSLAVVRWRFGAATTLMFIIPLAFPLLSILGARAMNASGNNLILMLLLFLIPVYIIGLFLKRGEKPGSLCTWAILMIGISLIFMYAFRGNHIMGQDIHLEYFVFQQTFLSQQLVVGEAYIESCLSITILPTLFQSLSGIDGEQILKFIYPLLFIITPLAIYFISRKYFKERYAFLAAFLFMAQTPFYRIVSLRDMLATMFVALAIMVIFLKSDKINLLQKRALFLIMVSAVVVSHYGTSLMFVLLLVLGFAISLLLGRRAASRWQHISFHTIMFVFIAVFLWQSQIWAKPFEGGVWYIKNTFNYLGDFFILGSRSSIAGQFLGGSGSSVPNSIQLYLMYLTIALMAVGIIRLLSRYQAIVADASTDEPGDDFLKAKVDREYIVLAVLSFIFLVAQVVLPFISQGYNLGRTYMVALVFLPVLFIIGGATVARWLRVKPSVVLLAVLLPYFLFTSGAAYQLFNVPRGVHLSSTGDEYYRFYVHDQEFYAVDWLQGQYANDDPLPVYGDWVGVEERLKDKIAFGRLRVLEPNGSDDYIKSLEGSYIYLTYDNIDRGQMGAWSGVAHDISEYSSIFDSKNKVYTNGGSEVYR